MNNEYTFNREVAKSIQGIAVLMMIYHHLFLEINIEEHFSLLNIGGKNYEIFFAWFCKLCVSVFSFLSGYGLCDSFIYYDNIFEIYRKTTKRIIQFIVCILFVFVFSILFDYVNNSFDITSILYLFNIRSISEYNSGWWYVGQYISMLVLTPMVFTLIDCFKRKKYQFFIINIFVMLGVYSALYKYVCCSGIYCLTFFVGFILRYFNIVNWFVKVINSTSVVVSRIGGWLFLILIVFLRGEVTKAPADNKFDWFFGTLFVFALLMIKINSKVLILLGKMSLYIWMIHCVLLKYYRDELFRLKYSLVIFATITFISFFLSLLIDKCKGEVKKLIKM